MPLIDILKSDLHFLLFSGKGGVGKTTLSAAVALYLAKHGKKVLIISADPAHSLSDCFNQKIGDNITPINGIGTLYALEINAEKILKEFKGGYKEEIDEFSRQILRSGIDLPFERVIIQDLVEFSPPGLDELMVLTKLNEFLKNFQFDMVIIDTAATGHTIALMGLPNIIEQWLATALALHEKYQRIMPLIKTRLLLESLKDDANRIKASLTNPEQTELIVITIPEAMVITETEKFLSVLKKFKIPTKRLIINYVIPPNIKCDYCTSRMREQQNYIKEIYDKFSEYEIIEMPFISHEIRGVDNLADFAKILFKESYEYEPTKLIIGERVSKELTFNTIGKPRLDLRKKLRFILFGGKGGCGKTTSSAATALYLSRDKNVLVLSTDPAQALSNSFNQKIGNKITPIEGINNLYALEIDSEKLLEEFKEQYKGEIVDIAAGATYLENEDIAKFFSLSLPGLDELMALRKIMDFMESREFDLFILDTAPTGHTLRLLELPSHMHQWINTLIKMRSKIHYIMYKFFGRVVKDKADLFLERIENDVKKLKSIFADFNQTEFIPVTTLEKMAIYETERLLRTLNLYGIPVKQIIINKLTPQNVECNFCITKWKEQRKDREETLKKFSNYKIVEMPWFPHEIRGINNLEKYAKILFGNQTNFLGS